VLRAYDVLVHGFSNRFAWQCPTPELLALYNANVSGLHMDVGVGSGYFLDHCAFPTPQPSIALVDLNPNALAFTAQRIARYRPSVHQVNALEPFSIGNGQFLSIGLMYLLHCLPGSLEKKGGVFRNLGQQLASGGVLFGATILGQGPAKPRVGRVLQRLYNRRGIFSNEEDGLEQLESQLARQFDAYRIQVHGSVALFEARGYQSGANQE
jgi:hypothetical protein